MTVMMGRQNDDQAKLFYAFWLEERVPMDHLLRKFDRFLDLGTLRSHLAPSYSLMRRPSIDPELMIRMLIVGYCFAIRSERTLCEEADLDLAYRLFCRLELDRCVPDHSMFSKTRHGRFRDSDAFRHIFETVLDRAMQEGPVGGERFAVDASLIATDANKQRAAASSDPVVRQELAATRRSVREYLDGLNDAAWGVASETVPKLNSKSDPAARWTGALSGHAFFSYAGINLIDLKSAIIVDLEATRAIRQAEVGTAKTMIEQTEERFGLKPRQLAGDSAYGSTQIFGRIVEERDIEPHVHLWDKSDRRHGTFSRSDFTFDPAQDSYTCSAGKRLQRYRRPFTKPGLGVTEDQTIVYRASEFDCGSCALKPPRCDGVTHRKTARSVHEDTRDKVRRLPGTLQYLWSRRDRQKAEMLFSHPKRILKLNRLRLRGPSGARDQSLLAPIAQNLRKMPKITDLQTATTPTPVRT